MERFAVVVAALVALAVSGLSGKVVIPLLRKLHFGQTINEIGPKWHKEKQGTPTMGGFMFIIGSTAGLLVGYPMLGAAGTQYGGGAQVLALGVITALCFGIIGFIDDYTKVTNKQNLGLRAWGKIILQSIVAVCFLVTLHLMGRLSTLVMLPFFGAVDLKLAFYPIAYILIIGIVNAVNLTDGLDGLASSVTMWVMCGYVVLLTITAQAGLAVWAAALAGGCAGFLLWNFYPAKTFMGDTGSMFLGGAVVAVGFLMGSPELIVILGLVYIVEALSVMIQVSYFKITKGKRLFKMTPIHHHFEMSGWSEVKIVLVFSGVAIVCAVLAALYSYFVM